jgi:hypothetical protein
MFPGTVLKRCRENVFSWKSFTLYSHWTLGILK